jgi:fumarate hydratase class II
VTVRVDVEVAEGIALTAGGTAVGAGLDAWAHAESRKTISRRTDVRFLAIVSPLGKWMTDEYHTTLEK